jgi:hypothetical protein
MLLRLRPCRLPPEVHTIISHKNPSLAQLPVVGNTVRKPDGRLGIGSLLAYGTSLARDGAEAVRQ